MINIAPPKGFFDYWSPLNQQRLAVLQKLNALAHQMQFNYVELPIVEYDKSFRKALGPASDVVLHQFFYLEQKRQKDSVSQDNSSEKGKLVLRPELTSGLIRALCHSKKIDFNALTPQTFYTHGFCFRYEKPQKGRSRQFLQWNMEQLPFQSLKAESNVHYWDLFQFLNQILDFFQLKKHVTLEINFLTAHQLMQARQQLVSYPTKDLCIICQNRKKLGNIFRILDCENCGPLLARKIHLLQLMTTEEQEQFQHFQAVLKTSLPNLCIKVNEKLTRGLDYYSGLVFELKFQNGKNVWAQNTILGGGQYALSKFVFDENFAHNSQNNHGFGFAIGIERFLLLLQETQFSFQKLIPSSPVKIALAFAHSNSLNEVNQMQDSFLKLNYATKVFYKPFSAFSKILIKSAKEKVNWLIYFHQNDKVEVIEIIADNQSRVKKTLTPLEVVDFIQAVTK